MTNLQVGQIELRSEDSFDIQQYVHQRKVEKIVVPLEGEILDIKTNFLRVCVPSCLFTHSSAYHVRGPWNVLHVHVYLLMQERIRRRARR